MIKLEACRSCGRYLYVDDLRGTAIRTETTLLDGTTAPRAALAGATLWAVRMNGDGRPHEFVTLTPAIITSVVASPPGSRPAIVAEHRCTTRGTKAAVTASSSPAATPPAREVQTGPKARVAPSRTASSASPGPTSPAPGAPTAERPRSSRGWTHPCHGCGQPVELDGGAAYVAQLGAAVVFAAHAGC